MYSWTWKYENKWNCSWKRQKSFTSTRRVIDPTQMDENQNMTFKTHVWLLTLSISIAKFRVHQHLKQFKCGK